jgi:GlpG protein
VTVTLIVLSAAVALVSTHWDEGLWRLCNKAEPILKYLFIVPVIERGDGMYWIPALGLEAIQQGQIWRLITPILIHFNLIHLLFNMLWLRDLGAAIELRRGRLRFALMVLGIAVFSNWAQYAYRIPFVDGPDELNPFFGGMSGVVFGLFGYVWMKSRFDPASGFFAPPGMVFLMMAWFFLCLTGAVGPIANVAHGGGLVMGMVLGYAPKLWRDLTRNRRHD